MPYEGSRAGQAAPAHGQVQGWDCDLCFAKTIRGSGLSLSRSRQMNTGSFLV